MPSTLNVVAANRRNLRILVIHPHLQFIGGSEILTEILLNELSSTNHEVAVLTSGVRGELEKVPNMKFYYIPRVQSTIPNGCLSTPRLSRVVDVLYAVQNAIAGFEPDAVLAMIQEPIYVVASKLSSPELGCAIYIHFPVEEEKNEKNIGVFLEFYRFPGYEGFYELADVHLTNSNYTAAALYKSYGLESNVVYPAVKWEFFEEEPDLKKPRRNLIVSAGRFVPPKRHDVLIAWFKEHIKPVVRDAELVIAGIPDRRFPDYYERVKELAEGVKDVAFIDRYLTPREFIELYQEAKVYVHLRYGEHFGMAPVEAMSQGTIPVLPERSGLAELVVGGRDGFTAGNDDEFVSYILHVLKAPHEDLVNMRRRAYRKAWYFNPDRFTQEVLSYLKIVAK